MADRAAEVVAVVAEVGVGEAVHKRDS
jgi:hypothetical protein